VGGWPMFHPDRYFGGPQNLKLEIQALSCMPLVARFRLSLFSTESAQKRPSYGHFSEAVHHASKVHDKPPVQEAPRHKVW